MNLTDKISVHNTDCMKELVNLPDNAFELAIVDPPYGINVANMQMGTHKNRSKDGYPGTSTAVRLKAERFIGSGKLKNRFLNRSDLDWDLLPPDKDYFEQILRVSENTIILGGNYFDLPPTRGIICWDKKKPWDNFSQFELGWSTFDSPARMFRHSNKGGANLEKKIHPTQKPVKLYEWLLMNYAKKGDRILDTHLGSGSIAIACHNLGFELTGYELDETYFNQMLKRFKTVTAHKKNVPMSSFNPPPPNDFRNPGCGYWLVLAVTVVSALLMVYAALGKTP